MERFARQLGRLPVGLEEGDAVSALGEVSTETELFFLRQIALDVVHAELDELVTADHRLPSLKVALMRLCRFPVRPAFRWPARAVVSVNHTQSRGGAAIHVRKHGPEETSAGRSR